MTIVRKGANLLRLMFYIMLLFAGVFALQHRIHAEAPPQKQPTIAALLEIKGGIGPAFQDYIHRGLNKAQKDNARVVILQIDTPGGLSKSMRGIIKDILASPIPVISYVAPSGARAASAGTYILYASHVAAMAPGTNLGAATPVSLGAPTPGKGDKNKKNNKSQKGKAKGAKSASELKALNDARAYIRGLAQLRKRNVKWAESAVTKAESLSALEALKLNVINFVAKDIPQLLQKVNGMVVSVKGQAATLKTGNLTVKVYPQDWRTKFLAVITDPSVAYILLMVGIYGLFFEFANPGYVLPGVVGAIAMLVALYALQLLPISYAGLGLIILGVVLIVSEAFVPSFGALGIGGIISFLIGSIMLMKTEAVGFTLPLQLIIGVTVASGLFFFVILHMVFRSRRRPVVSGRRGMVGHEGVVVKNERGLWVDVEGELWKVESAQPLQAGQRIVVESVSGLVLHVKGI